MADTDFKIKITTTADTAGAQAAASALQGLGKAAGETGKESKSLGEELGKLGARNSEAKDVIEGLETASRGGASGLFGLAKAGRNLWEVFAGSTIIGRVVQLTALAAAGFLALRERLFGAKESADKMATSAEGLAEHLHEVISAAEKLGSSVGAKREEALTTYLKNVEADADIALKKLQALAKVRDELIAQQSELEIDQIKAGGGTEEEKARRIFEIQRGVAGKSTANRIGDLNASTDYARRVADTEQRTFEGQTATVEAQKQVYLGYIQEAAQLEIFRSTLTKANDELLALASTADEYGRVTPDVAAQQQAAMSRRAFAEGGMSKMRGSDAIVSDLNTSRAQFGAMLDSVQVYGKSAQVARKKADDLKELNDIEISGIRQVRPITEARAEVAQGVSLKGARERDAATAAAERAKEAARIAEEARRVGKLGAELPVAEVYRDSFSISPEANRAARSGVEMRSAQRRMGLDNSVESIEKITQKLGDGKNEGDDLSALAKAIEQLAAATNSRGSATIRNLIARIGNLEAQARNGDRP